MKTAAALRKELSDVGVEAQHIADGPLSLQKKSVALRGLEAKAEHLLDELHIANQQTKFSGMAETGRFVDGPSRKSLDTDRLSPDQSVAEWVAHKGVGGPRRHDDPELNFDRWFKGFATGDWTGAEAEFKAQSEGTPSAGGVMVPTPLASFIVDLARNQARVFQAGATTVPMTSQTLKIARQTGDPALAWHSEAATIAPSSLTFDAVTLTAHTLPCLIRVSLELLEDAANSPGVISNAVAAAMALELDRVSLRGSGTDPEPKGIRTTSGVTVQSMGTNGAALTNYDPFSTAIEAVRTANFEPNAAIYSPRTAGELSRLKDTMNNPMRLPDDFAALDRLVTNQVPNNNTQGSASTASDAYVGQWDQLLVGIRTQVSIRSLQEKFVDTGELGFFAYLRADVQLAHPSAFTVIEGLL
jgi:HK97 family phage major capsid protein